MRDSTLQLTTGALLGLLYTLINKELNNNPSINSFKRSYNSHFILTFGRFAALNGAGIINLGWQFTSFHIRLTSQNLPWT